MFFIYTGIAKLNQSNRVFDDKGILVKKTKVLIGLQMAGAICLGVFPLLILDKNLSAILFGSNSPGIGWMVLFVILLSIALSAGLNAGKKIIIKYKHPRKVTNKFLMLYFFVRAVFLCAYELFFRGTLLFTSVLFYGVIPAIIISTFLTVLVHVFTNKKEMLSCVPFGILLSCFCISIHAVWPAIVIHLALSFSYEIKPLHNLLSRLKPIK